MIAVHTHGWRRLRVTRSARAACAQCRPPAVRRDEQRWDERLLRVAFIISSSGDWIFRFALPVLVLRLTGSAVSTALTYAVEFVPFVVIGLFSGVVADRADRRQLMIACDVVSAVIVGAIGVLCLIDPPVFLVMAAAFLLGCVRPFSFPAFQGFITERVAKRSLRPDSVAALRMVVRERALLWATVLLTLANGSSSARRRPRSSCRGGPIGRARSIRNSSAGWWACNVPFRSPLFRSARCSVAGWWSSSGSRRCSRPSRSFRFSSGSVLISRHWENLEPFSSMSRRGESAAQQGDVTRQGSWSLRWCSLRTALRPRSLAWSRIVPRSTSPMSWLSMCRGSSTPEGLHALLKPSSDEDEGPRGR